MGNINATVTIAQGQNNEPMTIASDSFSAVIQAGFDNFLFNLALRKMEGTTGSKPHGNTATVTVTENTLD